MENIFYFLHFAMDRLTLFLGKFLAWAYRNQDCMVLSPARTGKDPPYKVKYCHCMKQLQADLSG